MANLYYKSADGYYFSESDMMMAYRIATGNYRCDSEQKYFQWIESIWGKSIVSAHNSLDMKIDKALIDRQKIVAVKVYRDQHCCGLREAKDAVDSMAGE